MAHKKFRKEDFYRKVDEPRDGENVEPVETDDIVENDPCVVPYQSNGVPYQTKPYDPVGNDPCVVPYQTNSIPLEEATSDEDGGDILNNSLVQSLIADNIALLNRLLDLQMDEDLQKIKALHPDEDAESLDEFGEDFIKLIEAGVDVIVAYEVYRAAREREIKPPPPVIGEVNRSSSREKDFYTPYEVDDLTEDDFDKNPGLLGIIQRSMTRWK